MKKILSFAFLLVMMLVVAACGSSNNSGDGEQKEEPKQEEQKEVALPSQLVIATGGTSGTYYPLGGGIAKIITDNTEVTATAQTTGGSVENMRLLGAKEVELAFVQNDIADYASNGTFMFEGTKIENLQGLATLYNETVHIVVPADSTITSVADLAGKKVSIGAPGSGVEANALQILEIYGLTDADLGKAERLSFADSVGSIQDGNLDAAFVTAGAPTSAVTELSATKGVKLISLDQDKIDALIAKYPYYVQDSIPAETYPGAPETTTVAVKAMLAVSSELPEEFVYEVTKALFDNSASLVAINKRAESITKETAVEGLNLTIHPGALKFYQENGLK